MIWNKKVTRSDNKWLQFFFNESVKQHKKAGKEKIQTHNDVKQQTDKPKRKKKLFGKKEAANTGIH